QESLESEPTREARDQLSAAYARVGSVHEVMGARPEALAAYRRALAIREDLVAAAPADHRQRFGLAHLHLRIGGGLRWGGRTGGGAPVARAGGDGRRDGGSRQPRGCPIPGRVGLVPSKPRGRAGLGRKAGRGGAVSTAGAGGSRSDGARRPRQPATACRPGLV